MKILLFFSTTLFILLDFSLEKPENVANWSSEEITIQEAKAFYLAYQQQSKTTQNKPGKYIFWDDFKKFKDKNGADYIAVPFVDMSGYGVEIADSRRKNTNVEDTFTADIRTDLIFKKEGGKVVGFITHFIKDHGNYSTYITKDFYGYGTLFDLNEKTLEVALFEKGKITYSILKSKPKPTVESVSLCLTYYTTGRTNSFIECNELNSVKEYEGFMDALLEPFSKQTIGGTSLESFVDYLTPDSLKAQGKRVQFVPEN